MAHRALEALPDAPPFGTDRVEASLQCAIVIGVQAVTRSSGRPPVPPFTAWVRTVFMIRARWASQWSRSSGDHRSTLAVARMEASISSTNSRKRGLWRRSSPSRWKLVWALLIGVMLRGTLTSATGPWWRTLDFRPGAERRDERGIPDRKRRLDGNSGTDHARRGHSGAWRVQTPAPPDVAPLSLGVRSSASPADGLRRPLRADPLRHLHARLSVGLSCECRYSCPSCHAERHVGTLPRSRKTCLRCALPG